MFKFLIAIAAVLLLASEGFARGQCADIFDRFPETFQKASQQILRQKGIQDPDVVYFSERNMPMHLVWALRESGHRTTANRLEALIEKAVQDLVSSLPEKSKWGVLARATEDGKAFVNRNTTYTASGNGIRIAIRTEESRSVRELAAYRFLAKKLGFRVPVTVLFTLNGQKMSAQMMVDSAVNVNEWNRSRDDRLQVDIASKMAEFLIGNHDNNKGNNLVLEYPPQDYDGRIWERQAMVDFEAIYPDNQKPLKDTWQMEAFKEQVEQFMKAEPELAASLAKPKAKEGIGEIFKDLQLGHESHPGEIIEQNLDFYAQAYKELKERDRRGW